MQITVFTVTLNLKTHMLHQYEYHHHHYHHHLSLGSAKVLYLRDNIIRYTFRILRIIILIFYFIFFNDGGCSNPSGWTSIHDFRKRGEAEKIPLGPEGSQVNPLWPQCGIPVSNITSERRGNRGPAELPLEVRIIILIVIACMCMSECMHE